MISKELKMSSTQNLRTVIPEGTVLQGGSHYYRVTKEITHYSSGGLVKLEPREGMSPLKYPILPSWGGTLSWSMGEMKNLLGDWSLYYPSNLKDKLNKLIKNNEMKEV